MITGLIIGALVLIGLGLIVIEIVFIPGTTFVGVIGTICMIGALIYSFNIYGSSVGWGVTIAAFIVSTIVILISLKSGTWERFALNNSIQGKVNEHLLISLKIGETGVSLSALRPFGNAEFGGVKMEVTTLGELIESNQKVKVIKIEGRKIYVEQINI